MEKLHCKTCGAFSMIPMEVAIDEEQDEHAALFDHDHETRFYTCHVCGDNWLSVKETEDEEGQCKITFVHQMGMSPVLKRVARMQTPVVFSEDTVNRWRYFLDDQEIDQEAWMDKLAKRRHILRSICTN